jgi:methionine-rich copper-binding protein CopC
VTAVTLALLAPATAAQAHNYLVSSTPEVGSVLTVLPEEFSVTTNDVLLDFGGANAGSAGALEVRGPDGLYYGDGCVTVSGASISTGASLGPAGDYTVLWRVVSTDGHPVSSQYDFTWQPDAGQPESTGSETAPVCPGSESGSAEPSASTTAPGDGDDAEFWSAVAWVGGAVGAVVVVLAATLLLLRRRPAPAGDDNHGGA